MYMYIGMCISMHTYDLCISEVGGLRPTGKSFRFVRARAQPYVRSEWISKMILYLLHFPFSP